MFYKNSINWDAHVCPSFNVGSDLSFLDRYIKSGVNFITLNIGFDLVTKDETLKFINYFKSWINQQSDKYIFIENKKQLSEFRATKKLGISFDLEGTNILKSSINDIDELYQLGVKQISIAYNINNEFGGGCLDKDTGITNSGKNLIKKLNHVGILIDCSHVGRKTSLDIIEISEHPVIFSHSNALSLCDHPRNLTDKQIIACANRGGVIGINGIGIFLGNNDTKTEKIVEHIDYMVQKVGDKHVGIGLDCVFNQDEISSYVDKNPNIFPKKLGFNDVSIANPEQFSEIKYFLENRGYSTESILNILGENFFRIANLVWK